MLWFRFIFLFAAYYKPFLIGKPKILLHKKRVRNRMEKKNREKQATFTGKVNTYSFIHLPKKLREAWGITKGTEQPITIELTTEGALIIRKP